MTRLLVNTGWILSTTSMGGQRRQRFPRRTTISLSDRDGLRPILNSLTIRIIKLLAYRCPLSLRQATVDWNTNYRKNRRYEISNNVAAEYDGVERPVMHQRPRDRGRRPRRAGRTN